MAPKKQIRRILFVRTDRIGDVLMNLPAIHLLRQTYPKAWITVLLDLSVAGLLHHHPDADEVMAVDNLTLATDLVERWRLVLKIGYGKYDMAVISNPSRFFHFLTFINGIPIRVGYGRKWGFLLNRTCRASHERSKRHEIENNLELVRLVSDETWDGQLSIPIDAGARSSVNGLMTQSFPGNMPVLVVHAGTSNPKKRWPMEKFVEFIRLASMQENLPILLIGGPEEAAYSGKLRELAGHTVVDWTGNLNLKQLAALMVHERVKAVVTSDSGPMHIAWILGKPVVALFAKNIQGSDPQRWGPRNSGNEVICKPIDEISVGEVYGCLQKILQK